MLWGLNRAERLPCSYEQVYKQCSVNISRLIILGYYIPTLSTLVLYEWLDKLVYAQPHKGGYYG